MLYHAPIRVVSAVEHKGQNRIMVSLSKGERNSGVAPHLLSRMSTTRRTAGGSGRG
jgi:hypothetical protein